ncbi:S8 family serine peptidase [Runella slithyformis]|uniref:Peptidase S8 and S53 subtilisin kexin sedolisin n=1 Tax=Runella slithyformis (strain ATCC 29530 / DSM 19594 / LMG 11500 / NCIMB 11436 / LSU 4) TaxID=761193 RepID=A0A7U3ZNF9_RUNSL|nr:S8 family serine peptidase [Runella slithyformis]AEI50437.1 peptidase S8 and S53 subtilisin kexin sedolisin [Runella slithyformis DSM 19594]
MNVSLKQPASDRGNVGSKKPSGFGIVMVFWLLASTVQAQQAKYLVLLKDKTGTAYTVDKPEAFLTQRSIERRQRQNIPVKPRDLPVTPAYVAQIRQTGAKVWYTSRWLNAVLVEATAAQLTAIRALSFVRGIEFDRPLANARVSAENKSEAAARKLGQESLDYGSSQNQIEMLGANVMHDRGFSGVGKLVAILDGGFQKSNTNPALKTIFDEKRVVATFDFVKKETSVYEDDSHGNNVFSIMAGYLPGSLIGPAFGASYVLLRSEDAGSETRLEEANWLLAAEYADSLGVDVINTSLGYTEFDNPADNYTYADMNGRTALVTRAADWAVGVGMIVVASAGNEGNSPWRYIGAPADGDSVLAVGAVNSLRNLASFSSLGPSADGRIKPDVSARGQATTLSNQNGTVTTGNGTSYSAPLIAGLVAAFWQSQPHLTAMQVVDCIRRAGDRFAAPTPQYGYGIPTFENAVKVANERYPVTGVADWTQPAEVFLYPNPMGATSEVNIHWGTVFAGKNVYIQLVDTAGRILYQQQVMANESISKVTLPPLTAGGYFLKVNDNQRERVLKVLKQ